MTRIILLHFVLSILFISFLLLSTTYANGSSSNCVDRNGNNICSPAREIASAPPNSNTNGFVHPHDFQHIDSFDKLKQQVRQRRQKEF